jgi:hypothetical protein
LLGLIGVGHRGLGFLGLLDLGLLGLAHRELGILGLGFRCFSLVFLRLAVLVRAFVLVSSALVLLSPLSLVLALVLPCDFLVL